MKLLRELYEGVMICLALAAVWLITLPNEPWVVLANLAIWAVFAADYAVQFSRATHRSTFVRGSIPDLLAILPIDFLVEFLLQDNVGGVGRLFRLFRLFRAGTVLLRSASDISTIVRSSGLGYLLAVTGRMVLLRSGTSDDRCRSSPRLPSYLARSARVSRALHAPAPRLHAPGRSTRPEPAVLGGAASRLSRLHVVRRRPFHR